MINTSKHNIANSIIMRRQINAIKDLSPPKNDFGYAFIYDENPNTTKAGQGYERNVLQQIAKNKPKLNHPSPNKKIKRYMHNKMTNKQQSVGIRDLSFNSTSKYNFNNKGKPY